MRKLELLGLVTLVIVGCRTHHVPDCRPACDDANRMTFAQCVASGNAMPFCEAGNRMCCATMVAHCVGELDDQTVVSDMPMCPTGMSIDAPQCEAPCTPDHETSYEACLSDGTSDCPNPDDEECCSLAQACLGDLGDVTVVHVGCCATMADCAGGQFCDPMFWTCMGGPAGCGDGMMSATEECDDHNTITEECDYGMMSCLVCDGTCHHVAGVAHFCGDGTVDLTDGETCDEDDPVICDMCRSLQPPACANGILDGTESDIDCGGDVCAACLSGGICNTPTDCRAEHADCMGHPDCLVTGGGYCLEQTLCDDRDPCTDDPCDATGGCPSGVHTMIDRDGDHHFPLGPSCGDDCDDRRDDVFLGAPEECDGVDNDCDESVDEMCT